MPPRKKAVARPPALTDDDVSELRAKVTIGETPRVVVRTASAAVPAGTRGNVVRVGNPKDGEFIVVRLGRDEVPFAPAELGIAGRKPVATASTPAPRPARTRTAVRSKPATPAPAPKPSKRAAATSRGKSRRAPQALTVTLRFNDGLWTVEAQRGARRLAKPAALRPGAVKAFADHVDEDQIREALVETVESCRAVVEERAQKLRAELHAAEAALKEYDARRK